MTRVLVLALLLPFATTADAQTHAILFREDFASLEAWQPVTFPKIARHSAYDIVTQGSNRVLRARSTNAASGLRWTNRFDVTRYPILRWRWKTETVYAQGDATRKSGDDYPLRIYVVFPYDPDEASLGMRLKYGLAKKLFGDYPPHSTLNYIWANRAHERRILPSPYTDRAQLVVLREGNRHVGSWMEEEVDIVKDYRAAFGENPPGMASLALMTDTDNTGASATAYIDAIEVRRRPGKDD